MSKRFDNKSAGNYASSIPRPQAGNGRSQQPGQVPRGGSGGRGYYSVGGSRAESNQSRGGSVGNLSGFSQGHRQTPPSRLSFSQTELRRLVESKEELVMVKNELALLKIERDEDKKQLKKLLDFIKTSEALNEKMEAACSLDPAVVEDDQPERLMEKAREHLHARPIDIRQAMEKVWLGFVFATKIVFLKVGIWFNSHRACHALSVYATCASKKSYLSTCYAIADRAHKMHYNGGDYLEAEYNINEVEKYIQQYENFDVKKMKEEMEIFIETKEYKDDQGNEKKETKFHEDFIKNFCKEEEILKVGVSDKEEYAFLGEVYKDIKYVVW